MGRQLLRRKKRWCCRLSNRNHIVTMKQSHHYRSVIALLPPLVLLTADTLIVFCCYHYLPRHAAFSPSITDMQSLSLRCPPSTAFLLQSPASKPKLSLSKHSLMSLSAVSQQQPPQLTTRSVLTKGSEGRDVASGSGMVSGSGMGSCTGFGSGSGAGSSSILFDLTDNAYSQAGERRNFGQISWYYDDTRVCERCYGNYFLNREWPWHDVPAISLVI